MLCLYEANGTIYRGTGRTHHGQDFGSGILQSSNHGRSWHSTPLTLQHHEQKVVWDIEGNAQEILAITDTEIWKVLIRCYVW